MYIIYKNNKNMKYITKSLVQFEITVIHIGPLQFLVSIFYAKTSVRNFNIAIREKQLHRDKPK